MKRFASSGARICALGLGALAMAPASALAAAPGAADPAATAWILSASALVLLMTLPGLALFYGGLVREKNVLSVLMQCVAIACVCTVLWLAVGYSLAFSGTAGFIGDLNKVFLGADPRAALVGSLPEPVFFLFQTTFAIITPALIIGAVVERARFAAVLLFSGLWLLAVYAPVTHWIWGGGWLAKLGIMDYAGGLVVHATAGVSALVFALRVGPREGFPRDQAPPHNPGMTMIGAGLLWVGWFGFNGGSALSAGADAGMAIVATHVSACVAGIVWGAVEWIRFGRPSMIGVVTGVVAGLATVTPASGFVGPAGGLVLGAAGSLVCFYAVHLVKGQLKIDDSLDVFAVHGVGGILGILLVSVLASPALGGAGFPAEHGIGEQLGVQLLGLAAVVIWSGAVSLGLLWVVNRLVGLRASDIAIEDGLDLAEHGERASQS
jgi:ammonium transporter, Amt family